MTIVSQWLIQKPLRIIEPSIIKNDKLIKIIDRDWGVVEDTETGDPRSLFWKYWYGVDLQTGQETWAVIPQKIIEFNRDVDNKYWTEKTLRKIKR